MTFDGIMTRAVVHELDETLVGGHIKKINQVGPSQLTLQFYANGKNLMLYLSCDAAQGRFHLTTKKYTNPLTPPNFVMLLRKHLGQGRLNRITQSGLDRTVRFSFGTRNELGDEVEKHLVLEIMGRHSNLILLDSDDTVLDAIHRVSHDMSRVRPIFPGRPYEEFPAEKRDILEATPSLANLLQDVQNTSKQGGMTLQKFFYTQLTGFSPLCSTELCIRADLAPNTPIGQLSETDLSRLTPVFASFCEDVQQHRYDPHRYVSPKQQAYPFPLFHYGDEEEASASISQLIDKQTFETARDDGVGQQKAHFQQVLAQDLEKKLRKLDHLREDLASTEDRDEVKEEADLLAAYAHQVEKGQSELVVDDFFHENQKRRISLDPKKNGHENMDARYKAFSKKNTAYKLLQKSIPALEEEIRYYEQLSTMLEQAAEASDLAEIRIELEREGLLKKPDKRRAPKKTAPSEPYHFETKNGFTILVGRNNLQNDRLTLKIADKEDLFLHSKVVPGAHVILRTAGRTPSEEDIEAAAWLAAKYSSRSKENTVDIDVTEKKNVYKAKGAKPGMVYYNNYRTITVNTAAEPALVDGDH